MSSNDEEESSEDDDYDSNAFGLSNPDSLLTIENLSFSVREAKSTNEWVPILQGVTAHVHSRNVLAVIGGSGAGKTTLLDAVAQSPRLRFGKLEGQVLLDTDVLDRARFRSECAYVTQEDALYAALSVREAMMFAASLYLGKVDAGIREDMIEYFLKETGLMVCADVRIGDGVIVKGISGGQRRRLSVALEAMKNPSLLVLDEPTSGLDSAAAESIMSLLTHLAQRSNFAMLCTIHQPSSYVFQLFDKLLVLARGRVCYFGAANDALSYFERIGFASEFGVNAAEFLIRKTNADFCSEEQVARICKEWSTCNERVAKEVLEMNGDFDSAVERQTQSAGCGLTICHISLRALRGVLRDPLRLGVRVVLNSVGMIYISVAYLSCRERSQEEVVTRLWLVSWTIMLPAFLSIATLPSFAHDRNGFRKETTNGLYSAFTYLIGETLISIPTWIIMACSSMVPAYLTIGMNWHHFGKFLALLSVYVGWNDTLALLCGTAFPTSSIGMMVFILVTITLMLFNGTLLPMIDSVTWALRWLFFVMPARVCFRSAVLLEFSGLVFEGYEACLDRAAVTVGFTCWGTQGKDIVEALSIETFPVLTAQDTLLQDISFILAEVVALKLLQALTLYLLSGGRG